MNAFRRIGLGVAVLALFLMAAPAPAQALKQLPADAVVIIKLNNPQKVSQKVAALAQRLGLANIQPMLHDPLGAVKTELNLKEGFDAEGELVVGIYEAAQGEAEMRFVALLPVTDYKAFMGNLANVQTDGAVSTFNMPNEDQPFFATNWGKFAAITRSKELLVQAPAGMTVTAPAQKQLDSNDIALYANAKLLAARLLPLLQQSRPDVLQGLEGQLAGNPRLDQKFVPVIRSVVNQVLNVAEETLTDTQAATFGINLSDQGINTTVVADFTPDSYIGQTMKSVKNTDADLLAGMPNRKYFAVMGMVQDPAAATKLVADLADPVAKELVALGDDGKPFLKMIETMKSGMAATTGASGGYTVATGAPGQQGMMQMVAIYHGDAQKLAAVQKENLQNVSAFTSMMGGGAGMTMDMKIAPAPKTVDGIALDQFSVKVNIDRTTPQGMQMGQMMDMFYGPNGLTASMGALDDKSYLVVMGGDDALLNASVAAAKKGDTALSQTAHYKAVTAQLPKNRAGVIYVSVDNLVDVGLQFAAMNGFALPLKLPPDLPPVGITVATEGSTLRIDTHISNDLIESMVSAAMQMRMMMGGGGGRGGARPPGGAL